MEIAEQVAQWSKDPKAKVGCALVSPDKSQVAWGFNGFPRGIADTSPRLLDNEYKNRVMVHAELNALLNAKRDVTGWTAYVTKFPCLHCSCSLVQAGIARVVTPGIKSGSDWTGSCLNGHAIMVEAGLKIDIWDKRYGN